MMDKVVQEQSFFFDHEGAKLFATHHIPAQPEEAKGVVIFCDPWSGEKLCATRTFACLARGICREGYHAFRFDCRGTGDSEGNLADVTPGSQLSDIKRAVDTFVQKGMDRIILLGLRVGGTMAAFAAAEDPRIRHLILLDPIADLKTHFEQYYRKETTSKAWTSTGANGSTDLREDLRSRGVVDIRGFLLNREAFSQFSEMHLASIIARFKGDVLALGIARDSRSRRKAEKNVAEIMPGENRKYRMCIVEGKEFWTIASLEQESHTKDNLLDAIRNWLGTLE